MIRILIYGTLAYLAYVLFKKTKLISKQNQNSVKGKESYKNLDIKDADFEDINTEEDE
ncbi:MAG: hypothetical protein ISR82_04410 [Candidatus Marinimicrobia bacterium]|nr:hypothetical protein [Candidatus Neomarinimicrobiota bacterium]MBL7010444.1 hypothetical protein [Candidatus Neomarinimicrobiota bacterium]MBL7030060.1 hypothetical protein [Candidatus Neomarinimicrobiota bacterium]